MPATKTGEFDTNAAHAQDPFVFVDLSNGQQSYSLSEQMAFGGSDLQPVTFLDGPDGDSNARHLAKHRRSVQQEQAHAMKTPLNPPDDIVAKEFTK